jgi:hypothetical protein
MEVSVKNLFKQIAQEIGFEKKAEYYYKQCKDLLQVIGLRKSKWGDSYSIWLGISISAISELEYPPIHKCHVQCQAEDFTDNKNELTAALNEEDYWRMDTVSRSELIKLALTSSQFYFFNQTNTVDKVREYILKKSNPGLFVKKTVKDMFHIPHDL